MVARLVAVVVPDDHVGVLGFLGRLGVQHPPDLVVGVGGAPELLAVFVQPFLPYLSAVGHVAYERRLVRDVGLGEGGAFRSRAGEHVVAALGVLLGAVGFQ
jgi:hypothetical protein